MISAPQYLGSDLNGAVKNATEISFGLTALFTDDRRKIDSYEKKDSRSSGTFARVNNGGLAMVRIKTVESFV